MDRNHEEWLNLEFDIENEHQVIELLAGDLHCPLCGSPYETSATHFIRQRPDTITLAVQCHHCGTGSLLTARCEQRHSLTTSELTPIERAFFACLPPVTYADVLRIRRLLRAHTGNLRDLL